MRIESGIADHQRSKFKWSSGQGSKGGKTSGAFFGGACWTVEQLQVCGQEIWNESLIKSALDVL